MKVAFHTLGCKVNKYETEAISEAFAKRGAEIVGENDPADVYVVNTCTVTGIADRKSRQYIRRMKKNSPRALMVVTGCYAQVAAEDLEKMDDVDLIIGNNLKSTICDRVFEMHGKRSDGSERISLLKRDQMAGYEEMGMVAFDDSEMNRAYIKIEEGCNRFCSYCLIPYARGNVRSRDIDEIIDEAGILLSNGYKEIVLTGINTALYGSEEGFSFDRRPDEEGLNGLETVIKRLDAIQGDFRVRLSSLEPTVVDKDHVERLLKYSKLCRHVHLSIQSGSDSVLERMNRHYTAEEYLEIVKALREYDPLYGITTDIIVGFPGETDPDFENTIDVVRKAGFCRVHAFRYSPRKNTAAADFSDAVPGEVKNARIDELVKVAKQTAEGFNRENFDIPQKVLAEQRADGLVSGYTENYIKAYIRDPHDEIPIGEFVMVRLTKNYRDGCLGEAIGKGR